MEREVVVRSGERAKYGNEVAVGPHRVRTDESTALGGTDAGPAPFEMLLGALGSCISITLRMYAERKGWDLRTIEVRLSREAIGEGKDARVRIRRDVRLEGALDDEQRARLQEVAARCPVHRALTTGVQVDGPA